MRIPSSKNNKRSMAESCGAPSDLSRLHAVSHRGQDPQFTLQAALSGCDKTFVNPRLRTWLETGAPRGDHLATAGW